MAKVEIKKPVVDEIIEALKNVTEQIVEQEKEIRNVIFQNYCSRCILVFYNQN